MAISPKVVDTPVEYDIPEVSIGDMFQERNPSNWCIVGFEDGSIEASCSNSFESFKGSVEDFNLRLRG